MKGVQETKGEEIGLNEGNYLSMFSYHCPEISKALTQDYIINNL